jgi:hypothetical protein
MYIREKLLQSLFWMSWGATEVQVVGSCGLEPEPREPPLIGNLDKVLYLWVSNNRLYGFCNPSQESPLSSVSLVVSRGKACPAPSTVT